MGVNVCVFRYTVWGLVAGVGFHVQEHKIFNLL